MSEEKGRLLKIKILRFDPKVKNNIPEVKTYQVQEAPGMTLFIALNEIREKQEPSLQYDFVCRAGICGSCGMIINGRPGLACRTSTNFLPAEINLVPLPVFELIGDLSVNTGKWMRKMSERLETWIHDKEKEIDYSKIEEKMDPDKAEEIYELDRCVECGCCVAGCGTIRMKEDFVGAVCSKNATIKELIDYDEFCSVGRGEENVKETDISIEITTHELKKLIDEKLSFTLIDVREPHEYQICRIEGATLMPLATIANQMSGLDQTGEIITYCHAGMRSYKAAEFLKSMGFGKVRSLKGGIKSWSRDIDPSIPVY